MPEQLLTLLKLCLLALVYLFFLRVLRAVWVEVNGPRLRTPAGNNTAGAASGAARVGRPTRRQRSVARRSQASGGPALVMVAPEELRGRAYSLEDELVIGRAAGCQVTLDDVYASQLHARVFCQNEQVYIEDMGSTNGTYVNRRKVDGTILLGPADQIQIGSTILELA